MLCHSQTWRVVNGAGVNCAKHLLRDMVDSVTHREYTPAVGLIHRSRRQAMDYLFVAILAAVFVIAIFWVVAKTLGKIAAVQASPTVDDVAKFLLPAVARAEERNDEVPVPTEDQYAFVAENLSESVRKAADAGNKLEAVKLLMNETGGSLMGAKTIIEMYLSRGKQ